MLHNAQIGLFLVTLKEAINNGNFVVIQREKNNEFLALTGMTPQERENVILTLQTNDYRSGPEEDRGNPGEKDIWKFEKKYLGRDIYIKFKLILKEAR
ncbi:MAG: hypothetical protein VST71_03870 [Nitrospirota bacterium]|nr:hypothetical protein [Nitrospirota bacterium]